MNNLIFELVVAAGLVTATVLVHTSGLMLLVQLIRVHLDRFRTPWLALDRLLVPVGMVLGLFVLHGLEVWGWALAFMGLGLAPDLESALFVSSGAYSTAGWTGVHVAPGWRLLAAIESLAGLLLIGWSTAFLFATLHRILTTEENHPLPAGAIASDGQPRRRRKG